MPLGPAQVPLNVPPPAETDVKTSSEGEAGYSSLSGDRRDEVVPGFVEVEVGVLRVERLV